MRIIDSLQALDPAEFAGGTAVAIGKFDGVHRGHAAILERLRSSARERGLASVVFTFAQNPLSLLMPERCPLPLMSPAQRLDAIAAAEADACLMVEFDAALSMMPAAEYIDRVLVGRLHARHIIVGPDFRFGHRGAGDVEMLRTVGETHGFSVEVVDFVEDAAYGRVSSTRIREALSRGEVDRATGMLGRPMAVRGEVVHGDARGRDLGFPTANLGGAIEGFVPADGVYAGQVKLLGRQEDHGEPQHVAAISVGTNPTFTPDGQSRVEAYLLDFTGNLYGIRIEVRFLHHLRAIEAFPSTEALIERMTDDVRETRRLV